MNIRVVVFFILYACCASSINADAALMQRRPVIGAYHPLSAGEVEPSILSLPHPAFLLVKATLIEEHQLVDFEQRAIGFERVDKAFGVIIWQYRYNELDDYISDRSKFAFADLWLTGTLDKFKTAAEKKKDFNPLQMELNVQYPTWAQRILGKDPPKLSITGFEEIIVSYEYTKNDMAGSSYDIKGTGGINFDQNNQFTVTGSVGRLINVNIKASTKKGIDAADNDPFKNFKIEYKGEGNELEDEVVQEVSAGAMSFQMPGASLAGYTEGHQGLLGLKVKTKFGPLELTGIASQERGEALKTSFDLVNGGGGNTVVRDKDFLRYRLFFLDSMYLTAFQNKATLPDGQQLDRKKLQVWLHSEQQTDKELHDPATKSKNKFCYLDKDGGTPFKFLQEGRDYSIHELIEGVIRFDSATVIQETDVIGICMATKDGTTKSKGDLAQVDSSNATIPTRKLWILKHANPMVTDSNFHLAWQNVYQLPTDFDVSKFKIDVKLTPEQGDSTPRNGPTLLSSIMGLTDNAGAPFATNNSIYDNNHRFLIMPPYANDGGKLILEPFANPALKTTDGKGTNPGIYSKTQEQFNEEKSKYAITMTGSSRKSSFQLGTGNIMDKSEKVRGQDGEELQRDVDYTLDYQFGALNLISKKALSKSRIDVEYQSEAVFIPKSKVFLGLHGEMKLPFGNNSFVGASLLYQTAAGQAIIPKLGQEPYSKVLLDINTKMDFEPKWMTVLMSQIPLLATDDKSTASLDIEVANSRTNPNTDQQAYIDDFESSNRSFDLPLDERGWYQAAPPGKINSKLSDTGDNSLLHNPIAWTQWWYHPQNTDAGAWDAQVLKESLFFQVPHKQTINAGDKYEPTFNFECQPAPADKDLYYRWTANNLKPWAGIMYPFASNSMDRTKDKYFEFYAKGDCGQLYIDLGEVSEDICRMGGPPDGLSHNEDTLGTGSSNIDANLDIGVDGKRDKDEVWMIPNETATGWDSTTLTYNNPKLGNYANDPGKDKYRPYTINDASHTDYKYNYPYVNGKEENRLYDSKDLLGDGMSTAENYYRRFIDFDSINASKPFVQNAHNYMVLPDDMAGNVKNGWHLFRIPLNDVKIGRVDSAGTPHWNRIRFIRLFWTNFNSGNFQKNNRIQFARMRMVRNEWQDQPIRIDSANSVIKITATSINTEDNPEYFASPPPSVPRVTDDAGNIVKESALRLAYNNIMPGDTAQVRNILVNQSINLSAYSTMSMLIHGDSSADRRQECKFFFRFGNNDSTYYEFNEPLNQGWNNNTMSIDLHELARYKQEILRTKINKERLDTNFLLHGKQYSIKYRNNSPPNFAGITWMAMGIMRDGPRNTAMPPDSGEIWVDELKVTGVHQFNGWATRASISSNWAGFMNLGGRLDYTGADFQQMTATEMKLGNTTLAGNAQVSWAVNKFLPTQWGVNIPLGVSISNSITRPTLVQNTDVFLTDQQTDKPDGFAQMYKDYINMLFGKDLWPNAKTEGEHYQNASVSRTFYTGYDKASSSQNPFINFLLERLSLDYNYSYNLNQTARGRRSDFRDSDYVDFTVSDRYTGVIKYDLSPKPAPAWTKWKPFTDSKLGFLPERLKNYELSLLPSALNFTLADIVFNKSRDVKDNAPELGGRTEIPLKNLTLRHDASMAYEPINILKLNYTLSVNRNLDYFVNNSPLFNDGSTELHRWQKIFNDRISKLDPVWGKFGVLADERDRTQNTTFNLDPTVWDWLTISTDYSANYKHTVASLTSQQNDPNTYLNMNVTSTFHLTSTLNLSTFFQKIADALPNAKTASEVFKSIEKGLGKVSLNSITFNYNAAMSLIDNYYDKPLFDELGVSRLQFLKYQLGLNGRTLKDIVTGNMNDNAFGGMKYRAGKQRKDQEDRRSSDRSYSGSTSFNLPEPIGVNITNLGIRYSKNFSLQADTSYRDTTIVWPEIDAGANTQALNKIKLITGVMQNVQVSSAYKFSKKTQVSHKPSVNDTITGTQNNFAPLISVDGKLKKWPVNVSYSHTYNNSEDASKLTGKNLSSEHINKMTLSYELQKSSDVSEFRLLLWTVPLKGTFNAGIDFEQGNAAKTQEAPATATGSGQSTTQNSSHFSLSPHSTYSFSDNITGTLTISASQTKSESQTSTSYIFKLSVNIALK